MRLGGPSLLTDSQSAQHIVLDTSLTDILNTLRLCEKSQKEHENQIQQLRDSIQKSETETKNLTTKLFETTGSAVKSKEKIEAYKKKIEKNEEIIKACQEQSMKKQSQIDKLTTQVDKLEVKYEQHDKMLKEHGEQLARYDGHLAKGDEQMVKLDVQVEKHDVQLAKHDEQISTNTKDIDDIKKKRYETDDSSSRICFNIYIYIMLKQLTKINTL